MSVTVLVYVENAHDWNTLMKSKAIRVLYGKFSQPEI
jgi:hypothetical protein